MRVNAAGIVGKSIDVIGRQRWIAVCTVVLVMAAALVSQTAGSQTATQANQRANRITQEVTSGAMVTVAGTVHPLTKRATDLGAVNSEMQLDSMTVNFGLSAAQRTELDALLAAQQDPKSPQYHQWLTQEEYGARFGMTDSDLSKVTGWLTSQGFTVKSVAPSRNLITFSGTALQTERAFHTQLQQYELDGKTQIANATELKLPAALAGVVTHVGGLSNFRPKSHAIRHARPDFTSSISGNHFLAPGDWAKIYDVDPIYAAGYTGAGMHIGIVGQTYFPPEDITNFRTAAFGAGTATNLNMVCISTTSLCGAAGAPKNEDVIDVGEADLDVEWSGGIARDATVDFIYAAADDQNQNVFDALIYGITTYKVGGAPVPVLSVSYGTCEMDQGATFQAAFDNYSAEVGAQGQTILVASGDQGAACIMTSGSETPPTVVTNGAIVSWPASSPNVTAVGGTTFSADGTAAAPSTGADQYWNYSGTADILTSALGYILETSWNDTAYDQSANAANILSSSGGGVSDLYPLPSWQWAPGNYSGPPLWRFVPDVAFSASPDHDGYLYCTQNFPVSETGAPTNNPGSTCLNGTFRYSDTTLSVIGGTSCPTPSFGGMLTLLVQRNGKGFGNINPKLYSMAKNAATYPGVFHDVTTGNNEQPCTTGTPDCANQLVGYSATTGYDLVTGLGSIDGGALYTALGGQTTTGLSTTTTVSGSVNSVTMGGAITLTATVNPSAATGNVTFETGSGTIGTAPVNSAGTATLTPTVSTSNGFSVGSDSITAVYSGDATYAPSTSTAPFAMTVAAAPGYTLGATTTTPSISAGGTQNVTLSLTPTNYTGTVGLVAVSSSPGVVTATLNSNSLSMANGMATTTLTITTTSSAANRAPAVPWKSGGAIVFAVLLGAPFTLRRKRALAVLLTAVVLSLAGFMMSCSGGSSSTVKAARVYSVTVTPTATPAVTNPTPLVITVTVQ